MLCFTEIRIACSRAISSMILPISFSFVKCLVTRYFLPSVSCSSFEVGHAAYCSSNGLIGLFVWFPSLKTQNFSIIYMKMHSFLCDVGTFF